MARLSLTFILLLLAVISACAKEDEKAIGDLFESRCSVCHSTSIPKNARKNKAQWQETVGRMMAKGAKLTPEEKKSLVGYLAKRYKL